MQTRIGRLIADRTQALAAVGHDLRTPLARLRLRTEDVPDGDVRTAIEQDIDEMDAMIASLLAFLGGDSDPETPVRVDVAVLCATIVDDATDRGREAIYVGPDHCDRTLRPLGFKRALVNLVDNALHYGTRVTVTLADTAGGLAIAVEDDGPGIPEDALEASPSPSSASIPRVGATPSASASVSRSWSRRSRRRAARSFSPTAPRAVCARRSPCRRQTRNKTIRPGSGKTGRLDRLLHSRSILP